ncbi:hypothetical protein CASFOL_005458 [Castilleja foliolosa]
MILAESFESEQFSKCLHHMFDRDNDRNLKMFFDATIKIVTTNRNRDPWPLPFSR